jgi:hypothetical protein
MRSAAATLIVLFWTAACVAQANQPLCPKHIETPSYPAIAQTAHVSGIVTLTLTIDAEGNVEDAKAISNVSPPRYARLLELPAITNVRHWTFVKPPSAPYEETIVYEYQFDDSEHRGITDSFDLPDHVTIFAQPMLVEPDQTMPTKK